MDIASVKSIADAVLHEGYVLYPYRATALKNRQRWMFGVLYPEDWRGTKEGNDSSFLQTQLLVRGDGRSRIEGLVRCLHFGVRRESDDCRLPAAGGAQWQEGTERAVPLPPIELAALAAEPRRTRFCFSAETPTPDASPNRPRGTMRPVEGVVEMTTETIESGLFRLTLCVRNHTPLDEIESEDCEAAWSSSMASTQALVGVHDGEFVSLIDPGESCLRHAEACRNSGAWPVFVGERDRRDRMLVAPIILYDYPQVARQSPGDFYDNTEIDELLALRVLTLTESERSEANQLEERTRLLMERVDALDEQRFSSFHATMARDGGLPAGIRPGCRVRLRPRGRADALDLVLAGRSATIASVEQDLEDNVFVSVIVDSDPGSDLGALGQPGHRFFFRPEEVDPWPEEDAEP